jgi:hypothetical protein
MQRMPFLRSITVVLLALSFAGCGGYSSTASVNGGGPVAPYINTQPANQTVTAGQTATFTAAATGSPAPTVQWQVSMDGGVTFNNLSGATSITLSFTASTSQNGNKYRAVFTNTAGSVNSNAATLTVNASSSGGSTDVVTHHYDVSRSGVNSTETLLTTSNVNSTTFGKVGEFAVDGQIDGQALFLSQLSIPGQGNKDVLYVATENDTVYAVDAQSISGSSATILWKTRVLPQWRISWHELAVREYQSKRNHCYTGHRSHPQRHLR